MHHRFRSARLLCLIVVANIAIPGMATEPEQAERVIDLTELSLETLMEVEVTTVSRSAQRVGDTAAAVHVITLQDIRRAGLTSIPEALRLVPGLHVARIDAHNWAIAARGFNGRVANKLLVQIDGRSVYSPLFAGVFWDMHDLPLEDLDRIEVILGPGGTLWGANAVNGIINIVTRSAHETQGGALEAGVGSLETSDIAIRYGGAAGENAHYRIYAKHREHDQFDTAAGAGASDDWHVTQAGFRADWKVSTRDAVTVQGDVQTGRLGQTALLTSLVPVGIRATPETLDMSGGNLLGRWERTREDGSRTSLQTYWDHVRRNEAVAGQRVNVFDLDFQHRLPPLGRHEVTWGLGYRISMSDVENSFTVSISDTEREDSVFSAFIYDQVQLRDDLQLSVGSKFEHNDFTGDEIQPSARVLWNVTDRHSIWGAVTRAVRTPTPIDTTLRFNQTALPGSPPTLVSVFGNPEFESERVIAYELGIRGELLPRVSLDLALFYNEYNGLTAQSQGAPGLELMPGPPHVLIPLASGNLVEGQTWGLEASATWRPRDRWQLTAGYAFLETDLKEKPDNGTVVGIDIQQDASPKQQFQLHSRHDLTDRIAFDASLYWVDDLRAFSNPSYTRLDLRLGWKPRPGFEASLGVRNLLDERHPEFASTAETLLSSEIPRSVYGRLVWRW